MEALDRKLSFLYTNKKYINFKNDEQKSRHNKERFSELGLV